MDFDKIVNRLELIISENNLTHAELEDGAGMARGLISKWIHRQAKPSLRSLNKVALFLHLELEDLLLDVPTYYLSHMTAESVSEDTPRLVPLYSAIPPDADSPLYRPGRNAGGWTVMNNHRDRSGRYFSVRISDSDMSTTLVPGDVVIVSMDEVPENGDTVAVRIGGSLPCFRKYIKRGSGIILQKGSMTDFPDYFSDEDINTLPVHIIGKVIELTRPM